MLVHNIEVTLGEFSNSLQDGLSVSGGHKEVQLQCAYVAGNESLQEFFCLSQSFLSIAEVCYCCVCNCVYY